MKRSTKSKIEKIKSVFKSTFFYDIEEEMGYLCGGFCYMSVDDETGYIYVSVGINENYSINFAMLINELNKAGIKDILIAEPHYLTKEKTILHMGTEESMTYLEDLKVKHFINVIPWSKRVLFDEGIISVGGKIIKRNGE